MGRAMNIYKKIIVVAAVFSTFISVFVLFSTTSNKKNKILIIKNFRQLTNNKYYALISNTNKHTIEPTIMLRIHHVRQKKSELFVFHPKGINTGQSKELNFEIKKNWTNFELNIVTLELKQENTTLSSARITNISLPNGIFSHSFFALTPLVVGVSIFVLTKLV